MNVGLPDQIYAKNVHNILVSRSTVDLKYRQQIVRKCTKRDVQWYHVDGGVETLT